MALQNFVDQVGPRIASAWLNQVDILKETVFNAPATKVQARANLTSDLAFELANGGTGVRSLSALQQEVVGIPQTSQELARGVTPVDTLQKPGYYLRYGVTKDGVTDDSVALQNMLKAGYGDGVTGTSLDFGTGGVIVTSAFTMSKANVNVPPYMVGHNIRFLPKAGASGTFITIENPHEAYLNFTTEGDFIFDSNFICSTGFRLHGCQRCNLNAQFSARNTVGGPQLSIHGEANFGVYYNTTKNWQTSHDPTFGGTGNGIDVKTIDGTSRVAGNVHINMHASYNDGYGIDADHCSDTFVGPGIEDNGLAAMHTGSVVQLVVLGGYSEFNGCGTADGSAIPTAYSGVVAYVPGDKVKNPGSQDVYVCINNTTGNAPPNGAFWSFVGTDTSFLTSAGTQRLQVYGGRHIGVGNFTAYGTGGLIYMPGQDLGISLTATGIAFAGAAVPTNGANWSNASDILTQANGSTKSLWDHLLDMNRSVVPAYFSKGIFQTQITVASATNVPWSDNGNIWRFTGNTTINTIAAPTTSVPVLTCYFTSNVTVNDDSTAAGNIRLAGGANFAATNDDVLTLVWNNNASAWLEVSRSVN